MTINIAVYGLWHLGSVTAACLADAGYSVVGIDADSAVVNQLTQGIAPLFEPGLDALIGKNLAAGNLSFSSDIARIAQANIVWVTLDTPVDENDHADVESVMAAIARIFPHLSDDTTVLISSQLRVGCTRFLQHNYAAHYPRNVHFAYSPENLRLGKAIDAFTQPQRIIVGVDNHNAHEMIEPILARYTSTIFWMGIESAEMVKHSINAYLATCIAFTNEIATLCECVGADAAEVERGLRSEPRIGEKAYVKPGHPFAGGTLARDVNYLTEIAHDAHRNTALLNAIMTSNESHKHWVRHQLLLHLPALKGKTVAILGLAYTSGTSSLRRSLAIELCEWLHAEGAHIRAFDPNVSSLPDTLHHQITLCKSAAMACLGADALVLTNEHPAYRLLSSDTLLANMASALVIDTCGWLSGLTGVSHIVLGKSA